MDKYDVEYRMRAIKDTCNIFDELLSYDTGDDYWKRWFVKHPFFIWNRTCMTKKHNSVLKKFLFAQHK